MSVFWEGLNSNLKSPGLGFKFEFASTGSWMARRNQGRWDQGGSLGGWGGGDVFDYYYHSQKKEHMELTHYR